MDYYEKNCCDECFKVRKVRILHHNGEGVIALCAKCAPRLHRVKLPFRGDLIAQKNEKLSCNRGANAQFVMV